ncbi:MAG: tetratricopeptide repeat protein [Myxococcaceae bacterium]|nr:tetratricopeptide repeat protein [Myxococcaceae bacterium]
MRKQILTACVAALFVAASGCDEAETKSLQPQPLAVPRTAPPPAPPPVVAPAPPSEPVTAAAPQVPEDPVGLVHEDGRLIDHLARAALLTEEGDLDGALAEARRAAYDARDDLDALSQVDRLSKLVGDRKLRVATLERIAQLQKEDATPLIQQARVLLSLKEYDRAIDVAHEAIARDASNPESFQVIGRAHLSRGELSQAIESFRKVISLDPDHGHALNNLGFALLRANENEEALNVLTRAAELLPHLAYVQNNLGVALERMGRIDEAKRAYARASDLSPKYVKARVNASRVASVSTGMLDAAPQEPESDEPPQDPTAPEGVSAAAVH